MVGHMKGLEVSERQEDNKPTDSSHQRIQRLVVVCGFMGGLVTRREQEYQDNAEQNCARNGC